MDSRIVDHLVLQEKQLEEARTGNLIAYLQVVRAEKPDSGAEIEQLIRARLGL